MLRKSSLQDYWSLCPIIHTPCAASFGMSWDRLLTLLTVFHLNNNDAKVARGQPGYDPLFKIQSVIDTLVAKFQDACTPEEQLTFDEAICPF
jgi:hypothetical protein